MKCHSSFIVHSKNSKKFVKIVLIEATNFVTVAEAAVLSFIA